MIGISTAIMLIGMLIAAFSAMGLLVWIGERITWKVKEKPGWRFWLTALVTGITIMVLGMYLLRNVSGYQPPCTPMYGCSSSK